jgi:S1-C subfamily serine protease
MMQKHGGIAETYKGDFDVVRVQISTIHDLCVAEVNTNLGLNNKISRTAATKGDKVWIVGHPSLLPLIIIEGYVSDRDDIMVNDDSRKCTEEDYKNPETKWECAITGMVSTAHQYDALLTSGLIEAGSSGSPVYNEYGEVVAVVFAGSGRRGQSWCVPWEYINAFLTKELAENKFVEL